MADMLVGGHQRDPRANGIGEPFHSRRRGVDKAPHEVGTIRRPAGAHEIGQELFGRIHDAGFALKPRTSSRYRSG